MDLQNFLEDEMEPFDLRSLSDSEKLVVIHESLALQDDKINKQQLYLTNLSQGLLEILVILNGDNRDESISIETTEALNQKMILLERGIIKIYQHLEKDNTVKELKSGQQILQKVIEANQNRATTKTNYLDWQQIAIIITATALISSLCSLAVFQLASNWNTDQPQNSVEKPLKPKSKKSSK
jgi:hypothetical protein